MDHGGTLREVGTFRAERKPYARVQQLQMLNNTSLKKPSLLKSCLPVGTEPKAPFVIEVFKCSQTQPEQEKNECLYVFKVRLFPVQTSEASSSCYKKNCLLKSNHSCIAGTHSHHRHAILLHESC